MDGVDNLRETLLQNGWEKVTKIRQTPWGARECSVTTPDDGIIEWFENTLGWYGTVDAREENGDAIFAGIVPIPNEVTEAEHLTYIGFSLFRGEPSDRVVGFITVDDAKKAYDYVVASGWEKHSEIVEQPWGGKEFEVTTIDGSKLRIASY